MTTTIGVRKLASDSPSNVVVAEVLLISDTVIPNPLTTLSLSNNIFTIYSALGISQEVYDIGQVSLSTVTTTIASQFTYQFAMRFVKKGTPVTSSQFIGPPGVPGKPGAPGVPGLPGPTGPAGGGGGGITATRDLSGSYSSPEVVAVKDIQVVTNPNDFDLNKTKRNFLYRDARFVAISFIFYAHIWWMH